MVGLGRLCSHFSPLFYPINFTYYSFQSTYYSQLMLTGFHTNIYIENNNLKVVTIRIFRLFSVVVF